MTEILEPEDNRSSIAALLSASYHFMMGRIIEDLDVAGHSDLSKTQLHLLCRVDPEGMSIEELSRRVQIPPQIISNLVNMLAGNKYLSAERNPDGIHTTMMHLADRGRDARKIVEASQQSVEREWGNSLGDEAYTKLREGLQELFAAATRTHPLSPRS